MKKKTKVILFSSILFAVGSAGAIGYQMSRPDTMSAKLTSAQQKSLISTEITAVQNNAKPKDVINSFTDKNRLFKMSDKNKLIALQVIYTSLQNASLYYNNTGTILGGEIDYSRGDSKNPLDAAKDNKLIKGFVDELSEQYLEAKPVNSSTIVVLPDWQKLNKIAKDNGIDSKLLAKSDLNYLITAGVDSDKLDVFNGKRVDVIASAKAFERVEKQLDSLKEENSDSNVIQDLNSLLRIYNDATFGYIETNNITLTKTDGTVQIDKETLAELKSLAKMNLSLSDDAEVYLKNVDSDGKIKSSVLQKGAETSTTTFGTSKFWQGQTDITSLINAQADTTSTTSESTSSSTTSK